MVVDNEELAVKTLCNTICEVIEDAEITRSTDSAEALNIAKDINPDIVFLDIDMPGMDGMKLAKPCRAPSRGWSRWSVLWARARRCRWPR